MLGPRSRAFSFLGVSLAAMGVVSTIAVAWQAWQNSRFDRDGVRVMATVTQARIWEEGGDSTREHLTVSYAYRGPDGQELEGGSTLREHFRSRYRTGSEIAIEYLRSNPSVSRAVDSRQTRGLAIWLIVLSAATLASAAVLLVLAWRRA